MKKAIITTIAVLLCWCGVVWGGGYHATGLTSTNNRSSFAAGYNWLAWDGLDFSTYAGGNWRVILTDSTGRKAEGYAGSVGGGETLGSEKVVDWVNNTSGDPNWDYETFTSSGGAITSAINSSIAAQAHIVTSFADTGAKVLWKLDVDITLNSGAAPKLLVCYSSLGSVASLGQQQTVNGSNIYYFITTAGSANFLYFINQEVANWSSTNSFKQVTEPPATGIQILSTPSGSSGWASVDASFDYNAITEIEILPVATLAGVSLSGVGVNNYYAIY